MFTSLRGRSVLGVLVLGAAFAASPAAAQTWTGGYIGGHVGTLNGFGTDGTYCEDYEYDYPEAAPTTVEGYNIQRPAFFLSAREGRIVEEGMECDRTKGAATLNPGEEGWAEFGWYDTYLNDGLDELRGHLIGAQLGIRVQAGVGGTGPVWGLEVAHSILHVRDTVSGSWGGGYGGGYGGMGVQGETCLASPSGCGGYGHEWQGLFTLDTLTTATFTMGYATPIVHYYAEAGFAIGRASFTTGNGFNGTGTGFGSLIGAGVEVRLNERLTIFAEYNYIKLNNIQMLGTLDNGNPMLVDVNVNANVIKIGFNIALGGP